MSNVKRNEFWDAVSVLMPQQHADVMDDAPDWMRDSIEQAHKQLIRVAEMTPPPCSTCGLVPSPDGHFTGGCQCAPCIECGKQNPRGPHQICEACELGPTATHEQLWAICRKLPSDFEPWGERSDDERGGDCSCGCVWFHEVDGARGSDWGVCFNPDSPRAGLLTFEHQGCPQYDGGPDEEEGEPRFRLGGVDGIGFNRVTGLNEEDNG